MCGRYVRRSDKQRIAEHFDIYGPSVPDFDPSWNVAPQTFQPVVRLNRDTREREIVMMRWGLIPYWILLANSQPSLRKLPQTPFCGNFNVTLGNARPQRVHCPEVDS
jgi:putative SOS response-associated peptidase YedK